MAEAETKSETNVSKVIANILKAAREQSKQPKPEEVAKIVHRIYPEKKAAPDAKQARTDRIIENAKHVVVEAKIQGVHVSTGLHEWVGRNKLPILDKDPSQAFRIAKADLSVAIKASDLAEDHWVVRAASRVKNAESAEALAIIALAPEDVRENPNFMFQTAAQLAGSNLDPETQVTTKAFVAELKTLRGVDGFEMSDRQLSQALTEQGLGAMPAPSPDFDPALFSTLPNEAQDVFRALNSQLSGAATEVEKFEILDSFSDQIHAIDTKGFNQSQREVLSRLLVIKNSIERDLKFKISPRISVDKDWFRDNDLPIPKSKNFTFETRLSKEEIKAMCAKADEDGFDGFDRAYELLSDRIFTSGSEAHQPDITDSYEYKEIENLLRYVHGEESAIVNATRERWENDYRRNVVATRTITGGANEKELVESLPSAIASNTLNYEASIKFAPEAVAAEEQTIRELAAEQAFKCEKDTRYLKELIPDPDPHHIGEHISREEAWRRNPADFHGNEYIRTEDAMRAARGSIVHDEWFVPNSPKFARLIAVTKAMTDEIEDPVNPITEAAALVKYNDNANHELENLWKLVTLEKHPPPGGLYNPKYLNAIKGFSPLEIRTHKQLESFVKLKFLQQGRTWNEEVDNIKLRRAMFSARRYMVGSKRLFSLVGHLSNMPGLEIEAGAADVMPETLEYVMRTEVPERFVFARFGIGKEVGIRIMSVEQEELCALRGVTLDKNERLVPILNNSKSAKEESIPKRRYRTVLQKAKEKFGLRYTTLATGTLLESTSPFDYSTWRAEEGIWRVLQEKFGENARHMAYGTQLKLLGTYEGRIPETRKEVEAIKNYFERRRVLTEMTHRTPSFIFQLIGKDLDTSLENLRTTGAVHIDVSPGSTEGKKFFSILGLAERRVTTERSAPPGHNFFERGIFNLGTPTDFNEVFDDTLFHAVGITAREQIDALKVDYLKIIQTAQHVFNPRPEEGYLEQFAQRGMPITLTMSDFDLADADFQRIGASGQRRTDQGDAMSRLEARSALMTILNDPDVSLPDNPEKTFIPVLKKLMGDINSYKDGYFAEKRSAIMLDAVLSQNVAKDFYRGIIQAVPFLPGLIRNIVAQDARKPLVRALLWPAKQLAMGYADLSGQSELRELLQSNPEEWPKIFGQEFISEAAAVKGFHGNALKALGTERFIQQIEKSGLFTHHEFLHNLKDKYKTRFQFKFAEFGMRYWWVPWAAALAVGIMIAMKEQGLDSDGHK